MSLSLSNFLSTVTPLEAGGLLAILLLSIWIARKVSGPKLPPGPGRVPILGLLGFPDEHRDVLRKWAKEFGDVMTMKIMGMPFIIINTKSAANELLERRAGATSGRQQLVMANELVGLKEDPVQTSDPVLHKQYRRLFSIALSPRAVQNYEPLQLREARRLTLDMLATPEKYMQHMKRAVAQISFAVAYGYTLGDEDDMLIKADQGIRIFEEVMRPGYWLVDFIPLLQYLPTSIAGFKKQAEAWKKYFDDVRGTPFELVKKDLAEGKAKHSFVTTLLETQDDNAGDQGFERRIMFVAGIIHGAGSDTSVAAIHTFLAAMCMYPDVQRRAHEELDRVVGKELPTIADREKLPYCAALVLETLRWQPVATLGIPHVLLNDEEYQGYLLPKGTTIFANILQMSREETEYPQADQYIPERYLTPDGKSLKPKDGTHSFGFGFGRRVCPGSHLAEATIFAAIVTLLWAADISTPPGTEIKYGNEPGLNRPSYFPLILTPRFPGVEDVLRAATATVE